MAWVPSIVAKVPADPAARDHATVALAVKVMFWLGDALTADAVTVGGVPPITAGAISRRDPIPESNCATVADTETGVDVSEVNELALKDAIKRQVGFAVASRVQPAGRDVNPCDPPDPIAVTTVKSGIVPATEGVTGVVGTTVTPTVGKMDA